MSESAEVRTAEPVRMDMATLREWAEKGLPDPHYSDVLLLCDRLEAAEHVVGAALWLSMNIGSRNYSQALRGLVASLRNMRMQR